MSNDRSFLIEFINIYKNHPCLWKRNDVHYHNPIIKEASYNILLQKYREYDDKATIETVKSKINTIRTTYNKVTRKFIRSAQSGAAQNELYKPSLWYYDMLSFLQDQQDNRHNPNQDDDDIKQEEVGSEADSKDFIELTDAVVLGENATNAQSSTPSISARTNRKRRILNNKMLHLLAKRLKTNNENNKEGVHDTFGKYVATELNSIPPQMLPYVKKIINLAIFEGHMQNLNVTSSIVTELPNYPEDERKHSDFL